MILYNIMWRSVYGIEEVDQTDNLKDAKYLIKEYQTAFKEGHVFIKRGRV